jgi:hypothetical protein
MELNIERATIENGGEEKLRSALAALAKDPHAPREVSVKFTLHVHNEYPKHVVVGKDKDGNDVTKIVANEDEEDAALVTAPVVAGPALVPPAPVATQAVATKVDAPSDSQAAADAAGAENAAQS